MRILSQLRSYYPPSPPAGTGPHRYAFLVFQQEGGRDSPLTEAPKAFKTAEVVAKAGLEAQPVAFNFFFAENKDWLCINNVFSSINYLRVFQ